MVLIYGSGKYTYGLCHVFALGLHHIFGYQICNYRSEKYY